jgi:hypothetical protein
MNLPLEPTAVAMYPCAPRPLNRITLFHHTFSII